jgi:V/A-type H+-transporting ATPase subunit E
MAEDTPKDARPAPSERVLSDEILADAERKAGRARKRGEREAKQILGRARQRAAEAAARTLEAAEERAQRLEAAAMATFETEVQRDLLAVRERQLDALFDAARARLADKDGYDYPAVLADLAAQAIEAMPADRMVLELNEGDRGIASSGWLDDVRRRIGRPVEIAVADAPAPIDGGLTVRSADGRLLYDNSFDARIERLKPELRRQLAAKVFGERHVSEEEARQQPAQGRAPSPE